MGPSWPGALGGRSPIWGAELRTRPGWGEGCPLARSAVLAHTLGNVWEQKHWGARVGISDGGLSVTDRLQNPPGEHTVQDCWPRGGSPRPSHLSSPAPPGRSGGLSFWCLWRACGCVGGKGTLALQEDPSLCFQVGGVGAGCIPLPSLLRETSAPTSSLEAADGFRHGGGKAHVQQSLKREAMLSAHR